jgi:SWI/SNF-related matrix-associated actin-dependent regulator of chromatin subfamily A member 5
MIIQYTIEEKVIERAYKKLALDALVIQQGRLAEQKSKDSLDSFSSFFFARCIVFLIWFR